MTEDYWLAAGSRLINQYFNQYSLKKIWGTGMKISTNLTSIYQIIHAMTSLKMLSHKPFFFPVVSTRQNTQTLVQHSSSTVLNLFPLYAWLHFMLIILMFSFWLWHFDLPSCSSVSIWEAMPLCCQEPSKCPIKPSLEAHVSWDGWISKGLWQKSS